MARFLPALALLLVAMATGCSADPPATATPDARVLRLVTEPPADPLPPGAAWGCQAALAAPVRVTHADGSMVFVSVATGRPVSLVWPRGFSARLVDGTAHLLGRDGRVVGREGDVLDELGGGMGADGDAFHVCSIGPAMFPPLP